MIARIAVLGAGTMGRGIAQVAALAQLDTTLYDVDEAVLEGAREGIDASVTKGIEKGKTPPGARDHIGAHLSCTASFDKALAGAECVIEAAPESLELKIDIFRRAAAVVGDRCILGSNTSSLPITGIAAGVPLPERVIGLHFFNPVPIMALVEVVRGLETSDPVTEASVELARRLGKEPIVVKDSPGFATSRLGLVIGLEAA